MRCLCCGLPIVCQYYNDHHNTIIVECTADGNLYYYLSSLFYQCRDYKYCKTHKYQPRIPCKLHEPAIQQQTHIFYSHIQTMIVESLQTNPFCLIIANATLPPKELVKIGKNLQVPVYISNSNLPRDEIMKKTGIIGLYHTSLVNLTRIRFLKLYLQISLLLILIVIIGTKIIGG